jgi:ArsR family transcriptional regulator, lead/cadmium/zinc/bismuth-responsive transcriptional repressor
MAADNKSKNGSVDYPEEVKEAINDIGGLDRILNAIKSDEIEAEVKLHRILSDKTRLTILKAIRQCDLCPCVIKVLLKISDSRLSYHLMVLEGAGLITSYKKKNWKIFKITDKGRSI